MDDKRIVGVDIGSYAVKVAHLDPKSAELNVLGFDRERVPALTPAKSPAEGPTASPAAARPAGPPPLPGPQALDDEPTGVREAPADPDATDPLAGDADATAEAGAASASASIELHTASPWVEALAVLRDRGALAGALQSTAMPEAGAVIVEVDVPFPDKAKVRDILPHLMSDRLPLPASEVTWDFQTFALEDPTQGARALVGFARNDDLHRVLDELGRVGVDPAQLGLAELQLAAIGSHVAGASSEVTAFVDLGHEFTRVVVVRGQEPLLGRTVRVGGRHITDAIAAAFGQSFEEAEKVKHQYGAILSDANASNPDMKKLSDAIKDALRPIVRDLRRTFQGLYAKKRVEVQRVFITGGTSLLKNIEQHLAAELDLSVRRLPTNLVGLGDAEANATGLAAVAAALMQQNEGYRTRAINLRSGQFAYRGRSSYLRRQLMFAAAAIFGLMVVLGVTLYMEKLAYEAQRDAMKAALQEQTKALLGAPLDSKAAIQRVMEGESSGGTSFIPRMSAYELLHELTVKVPKDVELTLDRIEVDTDRNLIQVYGATTDAQAVDRIVAELREQIPCLKDIKKDKLKVRDDKADFELQIASGCS